MVDDADARRLVANGDIPESLLVLGQVLNDHFRIAHAEYPVGTKLSVEFDFGEYIETAIHVESNLAYIDLALDHEGKWHVMSDGLCRLM